MCLKRLKGLNKVHLVDAGFVWTEPHSKRIKVKLTVQKEVCGRGWVVGRWMWCCGWRGGCSVCVEVGVVYVEVLWVKEVGVVEGWRGWVKEVGVLIGKGEG